MRAFPSRLLPWTWLLLFPLLAPGTVADHPGGIIGHLQVHEGTVGPRQTQEFRPDPAEEGPFHAGWVFVLYGRVENGSLQVHVASESGAEAAHWTWDANASQGRTAALRADGPHVVSLHNPGPGNVSYAFYFDMSCSCPGKAIPLSGGFVLFNFDLPVHRTVQVSFASTPLWHLAGAAAVLEGDGGSWPEDFRVLEERTHSGRGFLRLNVTPPEEGRTFVFVEALGGVYEGAPVLLTPQLEGATEPEEASGAPMLLVLAGVMMAARAATRRRWDGTRAGAS